MDRPSIAPPKPFSPDWMIEAFGEPHPPEVVALIFDRTSDDWTMAEVRQEVLRLAARRQQRKAEVMMAQAAVVEWHRLNRAVARCVDDNDYEGALKAARAAEQFASWNREAIDAERARMDGLYGSG